MSGTKKRNSETTSLRSMSLGRDSVLITTKTSQPTMTQHVNVGCMSGIFQFVSKYHTHRKFLTSGNKKQDRKSISTPPNKSQNATCQKQNATCQTKRATLEIPRSPTIPADLRRHPWDPPREMPRGTGLDITPTTTPAPAPVTAAAEKKRRLLGALEKCDEDLQALRKIIEAVRGVQMSPTTPPPRGGGAKRNGGEEEGSEEPSPVSVIEYHRMVARSPIMSCSLRIKHDGNVDQKHEQIQKHQQCLQRPIKRPGEEANAVFRAPNKAATLATTTATTSSWSSATRECVIQVCKAIESGHGREVGMLVLVLEDLVFRDLLHEFINDLCCLCHFSACKRKLSF